MKRIKYIILSLSVITMLGGLFTSLAIPTPVSAACGNQKTFLGIPFWYSGLQNSSCDVVVPAGENGLSKFIWTIVLNIIQALSMLIGYIATYFVLYGGFQFIMSQGTPDKMVKARTTILHAVIGLVLSISSVAIVKLILSIA